MRFFNTILHGFPSRIVNRVKNPSLVFQQASAKIISLIFKGKGIVENLGLIDPIAFAQGLNDDNLSDNQLIEEGVRLYKRYIQSPPTTDNQPDTNLVVQPGLNFQAM